MEKFWSPRPDVAEYVARGIPQGANVLEIGPGVVPFSRSTQFVDRLARTGLPGPLHRLDVVREPLPFADKGFDFIYCRHVVEDLVYPDLLLSEMARVGRAGYIETPSPIAELTRGVDGPRHGQQTPYRGYIHHRWIVWASGGTLHLLEKANAIEHIDLFTIEADEDLRRPLAWNTYLLWQDNFSFKRHEHDLDYNLHTGYREELLAAHAAGKRNETKIRELLTSSAGNVKNAHAPSTR